MPVGGRGRGKPEKWLVAGHGGCHAAGMLLLAHRDLGGEGRPPLVILHGLLGSSRNWQTTGRDLTERYHVFALDLRNHGNSPHAEPMDYPPMVEDVVRWLDQRGLPRVHLLGHSMGGKVAMLLACRHPERVDGLTIVDIAPRDYTWPGHRQSFAAMNELQLADVHSRAEAELRLEARVPDWAMRKFLTTNLERGPDGRWFWQVNLPVITAALDALERMPLGPDDRFPGPTRFIAGGKSNYVEETDVAAIRRHFPSAELVTLPEAGHNPHLESRPAFVEQVLR